MILHKKTIDCSDEQVCTLQLEQLLQLQQDVLEMIAVGKPTDETLDALCTLVEAMLPNSVASIMLLNAEQGHLMVRAAPSIPAAGIEALNGLQPGPNAGSCGTAVFNQQPVYVANTLTDIRWSAHLDLAERFKLQACWSVPIRTTGGAVVGSFALTSFETRPPNLFHERLLDTAGFLAGIVLEREQYAESLVSAATAFDHMSEAVMVIDENRHIVQVNKAFERITGYSADEAIGNTPRLLKSDHQDAEFYRDFYQRLVRDGEWRGEIWNRRKNGNVYPQWLSVRVVRNAVGEVQRYVSVFADITEIKESERKLWRLAHHDALCDLPNRLMLRDRLDHATHQARHHGEHVAVLFFDLDRFKNVNDSLGHQAGDQLLKAVAARLAGVVDEDDTVARLGGDEFVILLENDPDANAALRVAERLVQQLAKSFVIADKRLFVTASIGISLFPEDADNPDQLMQHADTAMYQAKALGRNRVAFYSPELTRSASHRLAMEHDLRRAVDEGRFVLHYQPQFSVGDGRLVGIEALVRWVHPERGIVKPADFIQVAEETGLIGQVGDWVVEEACREAQVLRQHGHTGFSLAVNLSPYQLDEGLAERMQAVFAGTGFPPSAFEFEVTESLFVPEGGVALQQLTRMREQLGIGIAMDDFGTGHASLHQLKLLPISKVKIDRSFVNDLPDDQNDAAISRAIVLMAHALDLQVVAEGVETEAQQRFLDDCGCEFIQGYLLARPMSVHTLLTFFNGLGNTKG